MLQIIVERFVWILKKLGKESQMENNSPLAENLLKIYLLISKSHKQSSTSSHVSFKKNPSFTFHDQTEQKCKMFFIQNFIIDSPKDKMSISTTSEIRNIQQNANIHVVFTLVQQFA